MADMDRSVIPGAQTEGSGLKDICRLRDWDWTVKRFWQEGISVHRRHRKNDPPLYRRGEQHVHKGVIWTKVMLVGAKL